jgi:hypothetical protein
MLAGRLPSLVALVSLFLHLSLPLSARQEAAVPGTGSAVTGLDGRPVAPLDGGGRATVLLFTAVDCPISDRYAPEVRRLAARFAASGVRTWLVYANAGEAPEAARRHAAAFGYDLPVALDGAAALADRAHAEVTPEAAVFDAAGRLVYRGRIDDRYVAFGVDRPAPTTHDLADAVSAVLAGTPVSRAAVPAIGCAIVRQRP